MSNKAKTIAGGSVAFAADFLTVLGFFLDHPSVLDPFVDYAVIWLPILTFLLGWYSGHHFRLWMADEENARREAELDDSMRCEIAHLDRLPKVALFLIYSNGSIEFHEPDELGDDMNQSLEELKELGMADYETSAKGRCWKLTERCSKVLMEHPELAEEARRVADKFSE